MSDSACCPTHRDEDSLDTGAKAAPASRHARASKTSTDGMVRLEGRTFLMGTDSDEGFPADGEGPVREVQVDPFYMDTTAVTNSEFREFIEATDYVTDAEKYGWSFVFQNFLPDRISNRARRSKSAPWWCAVKDACWKWPLGRGSHVSNRLDHPVVHISWNDAVAYSKWVGKRLPTETEWEYAARGGLTQRTFPWGDELTPKNEHRCNIWQGAFPENNTVEDGYRYTAPVDTFAPNGYGLYQMAGNTWEWCLDWFSSDYHVDGPRNNPTGPPSGEAKVIRGGSYLCHRSYCNRYRVAARTANTPDSSTGNLGLRCVCDDS